MRAFRPDQRDRRNMLGNRGAIDLQVRPFRLQPLFQPGQHPGSATCGGGHQKMVFTQAGCDTVVKDNTISLAHQTVAALSHRQCREDVGINAVKEYRCVRTLDIDLSKGRGIHHCHTVSCGQALAPHGITHTLSWLGKIPRPLPLPYILEYRGCFYMPLMKWCDADRIRDQPAFASGKCSKRYRHIRWPKGKSTYISR